jgi:hypothetical protein
MDDESRLVRCPIVCITVRTHGPDASLPFLLLPGQLCNVCRTSYCYIARFSRAAGWKICRICLDTLPRELVTCFMMLWYISLKRYKRKSGYRRAHAIESIPRHASTSTCLASYFTTLLFHCPYWFHSNTWSFKWRYWICQASISAAHHPPCSRNSAKEILTMSDPVGNNEASLDSPFHERCRLGNDYYFTNEQIGWVYFHI